MAFIFRGTRYEAVKKPLFAEIFAGERGIAELRGMPQGSAVDVAHMTSTESMFVEAHWALKRAGEKITLAELVNEEFEAIEQIIPPKPADTSTEPEMIPDPLEGAIPTVPPDGSPPQDESQKTPAPL